MESKYKILFLATKVYEDLGKIFRLLGVDVKIAESSEGLLSILKNILESQQIEYAIILMPEEYIVMTRSIREKLNEEKRYMPAFLFLPDTKHPKFLQLDELDELLKRVQGISIKQMYEQVRKGGQS